MKNLTYNNGSLGYCGKTLFLSGIVQSIGQIITVVFSACVVSLVPLQYIIAAIVVAAVTGHYVAKYSARKVAEMCSVLGREIGIQMLELSKSTIPSAWVGFGVGAIVSMLFWPSALLLYAALNAVIIWGVLVFYLESDYLLSVEPKK